MKIIGKNPITGLDYPDPDVIRVDDTYYMVSTTMHFVPGCEILRSYDLVHWEHLSYVYERLDSTEEQRLVGEKNCYGKGMWAASLRYHKGMYYICFVANDHSPQSKYNTSLYGIGAMQPTCLFHSSFSPRQVSVPLCCPVFHTHSSDVPSERDHKTAGFHTPAQSALWCLPCNTYRLPG